MQRRDYFLTLSGLNFHITEWGDPQGFPMLLLHGIRGYGETFADLVQRLPAGYRFIALDQRGRGQSDWDPGCNYYTDAYVADMEALVARLALDRFDLLGHSMGGINAIVYAARHPGKVRQLVIEDAGPGAFENSAGATRIRRELATTPSHFATWEEASAFMRALRPSVTEEARQQRLHNMLKQVAGGAYTWRYDHVGISATRLTPDTSRVVDLRPHVMALACPTLVVRGERSDYLSAEIAAEMRQLNARILSRTIADAGHYIHDDQPQAFAQVVRQFLAQEQQPLAEENP
ncbi:hydrolase [Herbaspirillum rubrisubalbicans]|jgi:pimeloyl-ACP methyl ester carboxylesterase|uniref:Hydrolase n=2 Tax=Herbaspirillum rubrisubalbicans TaxID=80842 RepID=A0ABX9BW84_9BURK|nr:alpha/beta hydrolase [Herbaspirillum rubrisubalbicans]MCP1574454.1 pimeloyl-ACP methyl ester carboxylesterase [Herbaspirillum rubrisubalbicans]QJQ02929.1 alpha/beta hydrolase [Herbaspirillum rubrisubalbicans Os34]RAM62112.1 hydrolase [Herbaspirillum rubrisubalbicans]RAN45231.1 hydrolase [Herbaspirillum rubrisubalbicans]